MKSPHTSTYFYRYTGPGYLIMTSHYIARGPNSMEANPDRPGHRQGCQDRAIMAIVRVQAGENVIESAITKDAVKELKPKAGDKMTVVVKSTSVMIMK
jgi:molybdopterin-binding protein